MKQFGLSKKERIITNKEFSLTYQQGIIKKTGCLMVRYLPNNLGYARLGIALSTRFFPTAVKRNRIKRLIREAFRLNKHKLPKGLDIIISIRIDGNTDSTKPVTLSEIQTDLLKVFYGISIK
ncbi:MAG: ribonuclease P protein component [Planctomycetota bacterium]|nr:ribonuclease P protein component [Planctomycetota bacterium]MDI6787321.1 ribonuclease P protein component [Planctomycetota bacterium]